MRRVMIFILLTAAGCASQGIDLPRGRSVTQAPAEQATAAYWLHQPADQSVASLDFDKLWDACDRAARDYQFTIDRTDYREGVITTVPMVSPQFFEPWRQDFGTFHDLMESSLQTVRRSIRFEISLSQDGFFLARPKVVVERLSLTPRRITSVAQYRNVFGGGSGPQYTDQQSNPPPRYWYAIGRDDAFERQLADNIRHKLHQ
jgi:hypothetical protein